MQCAHRRPAMFSRVARCREFKGDRDERKPRRRLNILSQLVLTPFCAITKPFLVIIISRAGRTDGWMDGTNSSDKRGDEGFFTRDRITMRFNYNLSPEFDTRMQFSISQRPRPTPHPLRR